MFRAHSHLIFTAKAMQNNFRHFEELVFFDLWIPDFGFEIPVSVFRFPDSGFRIPDSSFRFRIPVPHFKFQFPGLRIAPDSSPVVSRSVKEARVNWGREMKHINETMRDDWGRVRGCPSSCPLTRHVLMAACDWFSVKVVACGGFIKVRTRER